MDIFLRNYINNILMIINKFKKILKDNGCSESDIVLIHSDISHFKGNNWMDKCKKLHRFINAYFNKESTIIFPAFTYSFCKTGIFNKQHTASEVGIFDEYIRNKKDFKRTDHPIFSFSCKGKFQNLFLNNSSSSTGEGSVFEKLYTFDAKMVFLGCRFLTSSTFLHFVEQKSMVPYRYSKIFFPKKRMKYSHYEYYVYSNEKYEFHEREKQLKIEEDLISKKILKKDIINNFEISVCSAREVFNFVSKKIKKNPYYILGKKPKII